MNPARRLERSAMALVGAYRILLAHRARTSLAAAGVAIGVALLFVVSVLGNGASAELLRGVDRSGTQVLLVRPVNAPVLAARRKVTGTVTTLRLEDCAAIEQLNSVRATAPVVDGQLKLRSSTGTTMTKVLGTTPELLQIKDYAVGHGRLWSGDEGLSAARVAVLGALVAERLFPDGDGVGEPVRIRGVPFAVIGVLRAKGSAADGSDNDNQVLVPVRTALRRIYDRRALSFIYVRARSQSILEQQPSLDPPAANGHDSTADISSAGAAARGSSHEAPAREAHGAVRLPLLTKVKQIFTRGFGSTARQSDLALTELELRKALRQSHRLDQRGLSDDFSIQNKQSAFKLRDALVSSLGSATNVLALVAILIGGAGVAGIMLLSVQERTSEIALRIAVGARSVDIGIQFFTESMMIALGGGAMGVLLGVMGAWAVGRWTDWRIQFSLETLAISLGVACLVGVIAGVLPALQAARIPPIQAFAKE
ncbi:MAG TPA: ABC transporter permease [Polyangiaceae bacterium]|nr:ABC transporter permease [Polyangiaceae bacterium]